MRTPEAFVNDMVKRGVDWMGILAVARAIRDGAWYEKTKDILLGKGLMPADQEERNRLRDRAIKDARHKAAKIEEEQQVARKLKRQEQLAACHQHDARQPKPKEEKCPKNTNTLSSSSRQARRKPSAKSSKTST